MNNGYGKSDIFYCENVNGTWSTPVNLGKTINTPGSEVTPYYDPSGRLYFASDGLGGLGGLDIFYTMKTEDGWTEPVNLGEPYNSPDDDFSYCMASPEDFSFFASGRSGKTGIYRADPQFPTFDKVVPQKELKYCGTIFEKKMMDKDTARFEFTWDMGDGTIRKGKKIRHCFPAPGKYHVVLTVSDKQGVINDVYKTSYDLDIKRKKQIYISSPDTVKINSVVAFDTKRSFFGDFKPGDFYWNFGDGFKTKGDFVTYTFRKPGVYTVSCGAFSKTQPDETMCNSKTIIVTE
jgi:plastocyanin